MSKARAFKAMLEAEAKMFKANDEFLAAEAAVSAADTTSNNARLERARDELEVATAVSDAAYATWKAAK
jgi:hypothetical protein